MGHGRVRRVAVCSPPGPGAGRPGAAEEELQGIGRSPGLPGVGSGAEWASWRGAGSGRSRPPPAPLTMAGEERSSRRLGEPGWSSRRGTAPAKSCERRVWATLAGGLKPPPPVAARITGPPSPTDHPTLRVSGRCRCLRVQGVRRLDGSGNYRGPGGRMEIGGRSPGITPARLPDTPLPAAASPITFLKTATHPTVLPKAPVPGV